MRIAAAAPVTPPDGNARTGGVRRSWISPARSRDHRSRPAQRRAPTRNDAEGRACAPVRSRARRPRRTVQCLRPPRPVRADRETVRLIPHPLQKMQHRVVLPSAKGFLPAMKNRSRPAFRSGPFAIPTMGRSSIPNSTRTCRADDSCPAPPSISTRSGHPPCERPGSSFRARENRRIRTSRIIAKSSPKAAGPLMLNFAVGVPARPLGADNHHRTDGIAPLDVAVVVYLNALRRTLQAEDIRNALQQAPLAGTLRNPPGQGLLRIQEGMIDHSPLRAALGPPQVNAVPRLQTQRLREEAVIGRTHAQQYLPRRGPVAVELAEETRTADPPVRNADSVSGNTIGCRSSGPHGKRTLGHRPVRPRSARQPHRHRRRPLC